MYCYTFNLYFRLCQWHWMIISYSIISDLYWNSETKNITEYIIARIRIFIESNNGISITNENIESNNQQVDKIPSWIKNCFPSIWNTWKSFHNNKITGIKIMYLYIFSPFFLDCQSAIDIYIISNFTRKTIGLKNTNLYFLL